MGPRRMEAIRRENISCTSEDGETEFTFTLTQA